jgi:hypothetical protein
VLQVRRRASLVAFTAAASLVSAGAASAAAVERIPLTSAVLPGAPAGVFLTLVSPPQYAAESPGRWVGPEYSASGNGDLRGRAVIDWSVTFRDRSVEPDSAAAAATPRGWREQERAGIAVPHVAGRSPVGTLPGYFVLKHSDAMHETALAIPISSTAIAVVKFTLRAPEKNSEPGFGNYFVLGTYLASSWNRGQAFLALSGVQVEGRLPPSAASIEAVKGRLAVRGTVVDAFKHAVVGARVVLQRRTGSSWRALGSVRTNAQGSYSLRVRGSGRYRVSVAGTAVRSASVPVRG